MLHVSKYICTVYTALSVSFSNVLEACSSQKRPFASVNSYLPTVFCHEGLVGSQIYSERLSVLGVGRRPHGFPRHPALGSGEQDTCWSKRIRCRASELCSFTRQLPYRGVVGRGLECCAVQAGVRRHQAAAKPRTGRTLLLGWGGAHGPGEPPRGPLAPDLGFVCPRWLLPPTPSTCPLPADNRLLLELKTFASPPETRETHIPCVLGRLQLRPAGCPREGLGTRCSCSLTLFVSALFRVHSR